MNCPRCGAQVAENTTFCGYCGQPIQQQQQPVYQQPVQQPVYQQPVQQPVYPQSNQRSPEIVSKQENMLMGIIGAIIGAALGGLSIFLFLKMEIVASLSGLITAFCALKGYEILGGKLSKPGVLISAIIMLIIPWLAHEVYWATEIMDYFGADFADAFEAVGDLVDPDAYQENLIKIYAFTLLGGVATVVSTFKNSKK